jgi:hypothetical protein
LQSTGEGEEKVLMNIAAGVLVVDEVKLTTEELIAPVGKVIATAGLLTVAGAIVAAGLLTIVAGAVTVVIGLLFTVVAGAVAVALVVGSVFEDDIAVALALLEVAPGVNTL